MPPTIGGEYLIEYMLNIGPGMYSSAGLVAIDWPYIDAWARLTSTPISGWEATAIRDLSRVYISQFTQSSDKNSQQPWRAEKTNVVSMQR